MPEIASARPHTFVVRLWLEGADHAAQQWRGMIEHVPSGLRLYFTALDELGDFIALRIGPPFIAQHRLGSRDEHG